MRKLPIALILASGLLASRIPFDASEAHQRADAVLWPRFVAAANDWVMQHPRDTEHTLKFDKGDSERWKLVRETFRETDDAMRHAGY